MCRKFCEVWICGFCKQTDRGLSQCFSTATGGKVIITGRWSLRWSHDDCKLWGTMNHWISAFLTRILNIFSHSVVFTCVYTFYCIISSSCCCCCHLRSEDTATTITQTASTDHSSCSTRQKVHRPQLMFLLLLHLVGNYPRRLWCHNDAVHDELACFCQRFTRGLTLTTHTHTHTESALSSIFSNSLTSQLFRHRNGQARLAESPLRLSRWFLERNFYKPGALSDAPQCQSTEQFVLLIMVTLCNRADHYIFILFLSFFFFSSPNLSGRRLDVYHTSAHVWP